MTGSSDLIAIVSGLPRSGTSMMMQMIEAGGIPALVDGLRQADDDNPRGYYEFQPVKKTKHDASWLDGAPGKVVKMVYRLVYDLPPDRAYNVIFMRRRLEEVLASQAVMLARLGKDEGALDRERMTALFEKQLADFDEWVARQDRFSVLYVDHGDVIADPLREAKRVSEFLGGDMNAQAMAAVVAPSLYRQRG